MRFTLQAPTTGTLPFSVGLGIRKGHAPSSVLPMGLDHYQVDVKRRWSDGSVKHVIVSGRADLTANVPLTVQMRVALPAGGTALTASDIAANAPSASVQCGSLGTVNLSDLLPSPFRTWLSGPELVECHYRADVGGGTLLTVWYHVRLYADGRMWIRAIVENGYLDDGAGHLASNANQTYIPTVTIGETVVYNNGGAALDHYKNARWIAEGWFGSDPQVTALPDVTYLRSTKLVPHYGWTSPSAAALNALIQTYTPMDKGGYTTVMGGTGYQAQIGLLPLWDALYCTSGDVRALNAVKTGTKSLNSYAILWRAKNTNLTPDPVDFANWSYSGPGAGGGNGPTAGTLVWDISHHGSGGYLDYLLTGDYLAYETMAMQCATVYLAIGAAYGTGTSRVLRPSQPRACGWSIRTVGQFAAIAPDGDSIAASYRQCLDATFSYWADHTAYDATASPLGYPFTYSSNNPSLPLAFPPFGFHFWIQSNGYVRDIEAGLADTADQNAFCDWMYQAAVGILGPNGAENFCFTHAADYVLTISNDIVANYVITTPDRFFRTWGEVWTATYGSPNTSCANTLTGISGAAPSAASTGYWGNLMPAIAYAVDHRAPGARDAWNRLTGATNWSTVANSGFDNTPIWGVIPSVNTLSIPRGATVRMDSEDLIPGCVVLGNRGLGVLGSAVPTTGPDGPPPLFNDLVLPADANSEVRGVIESWPTDGTLIVSEDSSFSLIGAPDGRYDISYRLYVDGIDQGVAGIAFEVGGGIADGVALTGTSTLVAGTALAASQAPGESATGTSTLQAGAAQGAGQAPGATLTGDSSLTAGDVDVDINAAAPGLGLSGDSTIQAGAGLAASHAPGAILTGESALEAGAGIGPGSVFAPGAVLTSAGSLVPGRAVAGGLLSVSPERLIVIRREDRVVIWNP